MLTDADSVSVIFDFPFYKGKQLHHTGTSCCFCIYPECYLLFYVHRTNTEWCSFKQRPQYLSWSTRHVKSSHLIFIVIQDIGNVFTVHLGITYTAGYTFFHIRNVKHQSVQFCNAFYINKRIYLPRQHLKRHRAFPIQFCRNTAGIDGRVRTDKLSRNIPLCLFIKIQYRVRRYLPVSRTDGLILMNIRKRCIPPYKKQSLDFFRGRRDCILSFLYFLC